MKNASLIRHPVICSLRERKKRYAYIRNDFTLAIYDYKRNQMTFQVSKAF
ncbi:MAG: hypothetical protein KJ739_01680 [Nitrospinae bacterium]|nr:hypothetical protein [Nitrospinota bacterium]MCG2813393.1 hypothetical protein [Thermodesulfovibrionales bacterium]